MIFSRAKHHMAVISSIRHQRITNDYNDGANTLKQYLRYAEAVSTGREDEMHACLNGLGETGAGLGMPHVTDDAVAAKTAAELEAQGLFVTRNLGHSMLKSMSRCASPTMTSTAVRSWSILRPTTRSPTPSNATSRVPPYSAHLVGT